MGSEDPILAAALDPQQRARRIIGLLLDQLALNPELLTVLDLQEARGYPDPRACSLKARQPDKAGQIHGHPGPAHHQPGAAGFRPGAAFGGIPDAALKAVTDLAHLGHRVVQAIPEAFSEPVIPCGKSTQVPTRYLENLGQGRGFPSGCPTHPPSGPRSLRSRKRRALPVKLSTPQGLQEEKVGALVLAPGDASLVQLSESSCRYRDHGYLGPQVKQ